MTDEIIAFNPSKPEDGEYMASEVKSLDQLGSKLIPEVGLLCIITIIYRIVGLLVRIFKYYAPLKIHICRGLSI